MNDYRGQHQPSPEGTPLHLAARDPFPDIATHSGYYATTRMEYRCASIIRATLDRPDMPVIIYRAVPRDVPPHIHPGDWVTLSRAYAAQHARHPTDPRQDGSVTYLQVPASHVRTDGDYVCEFGYFPPMED